MPRAAGREPERAELRRPRSCATCTICSEKISSRKRSRFLGLIGSLVVAVPADYTRYLMNRLRIIWGYQEELSSTAAHGECSVGVNRNKKQTRHPARHPTRRTRWRWHETRSRPRLSLPRNWKGAAAEPGP